MALLSNINDLFSVDSSGAIEFNEEAGTAGYALVSAGTGGPPVWTDGYGGNVTGSGTGQKVVKWTGTGANKESVGDGPITFSTDDSTFAGMITVNGGGIDIDNDDDVRLRFDNAGTFKAGLQVATTAGDMIAGSAVNDFAIRSQGNMLFASGGNTERFKLDTSGNATFAGQIIGQDGGSIQLELKRTSSGTDGNTSIKFVQPLGDGFFGVDLNGALSFGTAPNLIVDNKFKVDRSGNATFAGKITGTSAEFIDTSNPGATSGSVIIEGRRDGSANLLTLRARDASAPTSALPNGQGGLIRFQGFDGTDFENMAYIQVAADGQAVANGDAPSFMAFGTSADGSSSPTERMRINSAGNATFVGNITAPTLNLTGLTNNASSTSVLVLNQILGGELITNGDFDTSLDWNIGTQWSVANGKATYAGSGTSPIYQNVTLANATQYRILFTVSGSSGNGARIWIGNSAGNTNYEGGSYVYYANGTHERVFTMPSAQTTIALYSTTGGSGYDLDLVSLKQVLGTGTDVEKREFSSNAFAEELWKQNADGINNIGGVNVGIGTTSPSSQLHLSKAGGTLIKLGTSNNTSEIEAREVGGGQSLVLSSVNSADHLVIDGAGNVGIGETNVDARLHISALASNGISNVKLESPGASKWVFGIPASQTYFALDDVNDNLTSPKVVVLKTSGNVGIGTTGPQALLDVTKNSDEVYDFSQDLGQRSGTATIHINNNSTTVGSFGQVMYDSDGSNQGIARIVFIDSGTASVDTAFVNEGGNTKKETLRIKANGDVGIGTDSPSKKLHVVGDQLIFGNLFLQSNANGFRTIALNTADGADNQELYLCGGATASSTRGAQVGVYGNEVSTTGGSVVIVAGNISTGDIDFLTANTQRMIINNAGNVGISTTSPGAKLDVNGVIRTAGGTYVAPVDTRTDAALVIENADFIYTRDSAAYLRKLIGKPADNRIEIGQNGTSLIAGIDLYAGNNAAGNYQFHVSTSIVCTINNSSLTHTGDIVAYSDARLKSNVKKLDGSKVYNMRGVSFDKEGKKGSGVIAQEIQKIAPELVHDDGKYLGVAYGNLTGYLIEAIKELKAEIEELKKCKCDCKK